MQPRDIEGECNAHLYISDNYGDNDSTMRCQLPKGHEGAHREFFNRDTSGDVFVTWERDERCWHEWVEADSEWALAYYLEIYKDEETAKDERDADISMNGGLSSLRDGLCIKCGVMQ